MTKRSNISLFLADLLSLVYFPQVSVALSQICEGLLRFGHFSK